jgi:hypothetical protein
MTDPSSTFAPLYSVPDLPPLLFTWLNPTSLALAACVCVKWRDLALRVCGSKAFRLSFRALVHHPATLAWAVNNLGKKHLLSKLSYEACSIAAFEGALEALQWLRKNGCGWDWRTCAYAAQGGHLAVLQWAHENGCPWTKATCTHAAIGGHLGVLQWARENGCDWDTFTCAAVAEGGYLAILQWARKSGCAWNKADCLRRAEQHNHKAVAAWIQTQPA